MFDVIVFAGTTEGCDISSFLQKHRVKTCACVATDYGKKSLTEDEFLKVQAKRMEEEEMEEFFRSEKPSMVIDATHPYAAVVTENVRTACENTGVRYIRVLRSESSREEKAVYVDSTEEAASYLAGTQGNVLLTTGSKELKQFTGIPDYQDRLYARVLSLPKVMVECASLGFEGKHLIGMQGPFSRELNEAMLRQFDCRYLVTKDSGQAGGFQEKIEAALACNVIPVIIGRPQKEEGITLAACRELLSEEFHLEHKPQVTLLGIGMGTEDTLTVEGRNAVQEADLLIGAKRMVEAVRMAHHHVVYEYRSEEIAKYIEEHPGYEHVVIVLSGDVGFYSGAKKLLDRLGEDVQVICGISSVAYFMAKCRQSWDDACIVSSHGRACNLVSCIRDHEKVFSILGTRDGVRKLAAELNELGMGDVLLYVGENLSYPEEVFFVKPASELTEYEGDPLVVVLAWNRKAQPQAATHGLDDDLFIRGKAPMTKEEIRVVSLFKLRLKEDSVCYDVGAGTGSVSVEMALRASQGKVYAIEKKEDALDLIRLNRRKFALSNLEVIPGTAPQAMEDLPAPTHAFVGGSSGNLKEILALLLKKNPEVRIVINCITLETVSEAIQAIREFGFQDTDIVQLTAARSKSIAGYHMMMGENPIYIITCGRPLS